MKATSVVSPMHICLDLEPTLHLVFKALVAFQVPLLSNYLPILFSSMCPCILSINKCVVWVWPVGEQWSIFSSNLDMRCVRWYKMIQNTKVLGVLICWVVLFTFVVFCWGFFCCLFVVVVGFGVGFCCLFWFFCGLGFLFSISIRSCLMGSSIRHC